MMGYSRCPNLTVDGLMGPSLPPSVEVSGCESVHWQENLACVTLDCRLEHPMEDVMGKGAFKNLKLGKNVHRQVKRRGAPVRPAPKPRDVPPGMSEKDRHPGDRG
jgi:hypothetical protein